MEGLVKVEIVEKPEGYSRINDAAIKLRAGLNEPL